MSCETAQFLCRFSTFWPIGRFSVTVPWGRSARSCWQKVELHRGLLAGPDSHLVHGFHEFLGQRRACLTSGFGRGVEFDCPPPRHYQRARACALLSKAMQLRNGTCAAPARPFGSCSTLLFGRRAAVSGERTTEAANPAPRDAHRLWRDRVQGSRATKPENLKSPRERGGGRWPRFGGI